MYFLQRGAEFPCVLLYIRWTESFRKSKIQPQGEHKIQVIHHFVIDTIC